MTAAAIYARKSTEQVGRETDDKSVSRQVQHAREFAQAKGWHVDDAHIYVDDAVSGVDVKRLQAKQRMLAAINAPGGSPFQVLVMQSNDRLSRRDGDEALSELKAIAAAGVAVWTYSDARLFEYGTFSSNVMAFLRAEVAAEERRKASTRTREALVRKARLGHVTGGRTFGYDNVRVNSHTERVPNKSEADAVVRIYELYASGHGLGAIARMLNAEGAARPTPRGRRPGQVDGWSASTVRTILRRLDYRGQTVYGRATKRDIAGVIRHERAPEAEWLRVDVPQLRIVPEELAAKVDARLADLHARSIRMHDGTLRGRPRGRPPGEGSPYLLVGLLSCGVCGGSMEVISRSVGRGRRAYGYHCMVARRKGVCANKAWAPMGSTDSAVLDAIGDTLLRPEVVEAALAHAEQELTEDRSAAVREALRADLAITEAAIGRLTAAIAQGGELTPLVAALETHERQRRDLQARLAAASVEQPAVDVPAVRRTLRSYLKDWQGLLRGQLPQAQQVLRRLVIGRLSMTPDRDGSYRFAGRGTVRPLLGGRVPNGSSPTGFEPVFQP
jgi:site-specific DNA recombinase